jgi:hypothetical protein
LICLKLSFFIDTEHYDEMAKKDQGICG